MKTSRMIALGLFLGAILFFLGGNSFTQDPDDVVELIKNAKTPVTLHSLAGGTICIPGISDSLVHTRPTQVCTWWHSLYPIQTYCHNWHVIDQYENGIPGLNPSDWIRLEHVPTGPGDSIWVHVEDVTITLILTLEPAHLETMYVEYTGGYDSLLYPITHPDSTRWHEIWPEYSHIYYLSRWIDSGIPHAQLSCSDTIELIDPKAISAQLDAMSDVSTGRLQGKGTSQICEPNSQIPIGNAPPAWQARRGPVALIKTPTGVGTGFLYSDCCLLTAGHVVKDVNASDVMIWFDYEDKTLPFESGYGCYPDIWQACSLTVNPTCDVAFIYIRPRGVQCPGNIYGTVTLANRAPVPAESVYVIGHPSGRCKEYSHDSYATVKVVGDPNCSLCGDVPCRVSHGADTEPGSSGSPVFDIAGNVIGVHRGAASGDTCRNCFVPINAIFSFLPSTCSCPPAPPVPKWHVQDVAIDIAVLSGPVPRTPTMTQWGVIVLAALIVISAVYIMLRRRRATVAA